MIHIIVRTTVLGKSDIPIERKKKGRGFNESKKNITPEKGNIAYIIKKQHKNARRIQVRATSS